MASRTAVLVQQALADTPVDIASQRTAITRDGAPVMTTAVWQAPDGSTRFESFTPSGSPAVDEAFGPTGSGLVVDYGRHAWWAAASPGSFAMTDPRRIASDLASGVLHVTGTSTVDGQPVTDVAGQPPTMAGTTVDVVIDTADDLPLSSTTHEPGDLVGRTTYQWTPDTPGNQAQLQAPVPGGLTHLATPPAGVTGGHG